jgi:hypothetical protein
VVGNVLFSDVAKLRERGVFVFVIVIVIVFVL